jgi:GrpB-like predicted nucleotidyltransferase (UPF0157 family)
MKMRIETVIDPNSEILNLQEQVINEVSTLLPSSEVELVGAMAVPMVGRPELDILVISKDIEADSKILTKNAYKQGPVVNETSFLKRMEGEIEVAVQIMSPENKMIEIHRNIIKKLREEDELRTAYELYKKTLSGLTKEEYKEKKSEWLKNNVLIDNNN